MMICVCVCGTKETEIHVLFECKYEIENTNTKSFILKT